MTNFMLLNTLAGRHNESSEVPVNMSQVLFMVQHKNFTRIHFGVSGAETIDVVEKVSDILDGMDEETSDE